MKKLIIENFQEKTDVVKKEHDVLAFWDETHAFDKSVSSRPKDKHYVFYDGPPFATGLPHYGHILASTIKDVVPRYFTMKGYRVERKWGWDCHGIPIENMIEKELDLKGGKKGIEAMGIDKFNAACRSAILRFDAEWEKTVRRMARWVDFKHSYKTMDMSYMESVWWAFKAMYEKGNVYEGKRVILYCPRCATPLSNFEIAMDNSYKELPGPSTTYKYKVVGKKDTYLLAWSTTPWNKLATPALAVNPDLSYVLVSQGSEHYILAKSRLEMLSSEPYSIVETLKGRDLEKFAFEMHYAFYPPAAGEKTGVIIADPYVTDAEGTGIVTLAVYGEDDFRVMTEHGVQHIYHVDEEGKLKNEVKPWAGMFMLKVNPLVNEDLHKRGLIYHDQERIHNVPVCYRCETRLYHAPVPAWFINVQKLKPDLVKQNEHINWYPDHLKHGRFGKGLESAPDWNISRSRYWGTPMPIWKSEMPASPSLAGRQAAGRQNGKSNIRIIGSLEELKTWAVDPKRVEKLTDIHREFLDDIEIWVDDDKTIQGKRIPEVFDCWVESGSMPYASIHYPFEHKELFEKTHPAQFIAEYIAQTRAWFYTLHVMSIGLFGSHTFENAVTTGTILAEDGSKMSKSKKNYPDPSLLFEKYGVDALRFYLMSSVVMKGENLNFSEKSVSEVYNRVIALLWNTFSFYKLYAAKNGTNMPADGEKSMHDLDRWMRSKTHQLVRDVTHSMDSYDTVTTCRLITAYIDELSTWYLRRSRERFKKNPSSMGTFGWALRQLVLVIAPFMPCIAELMYQNMTDASGSVHHQYWPSYNQMEIDEELDKRVELSRVIVEGLHALRKKNVIPVKQALGKWSFVAKNPNVFESVPDIFHSIEEEVNVKTYTPQDQTGSWATTPTVQSQVVASKYFGDATVYLDIAITKELEDERKARELVRQVQAKRKELGCKMDDHIVLSLPPEYKNMPQALRDKVQAETLADTIIWGDSLHISTG